MYVDTLNVFVQLHYKSSSRSRFYKAR